MDSGLFSADPGRLPRIAPGARRRPGRANGASIRKNSRRPRARPGAGEGAAAPQEYAAQPVRYRFSRPGSAARQTAPPRMSVRTIAPRRPRGSRRDPRRADAIRLRTTALIRLTSNELDVGDVPAGRSARDLVSSPLTGWTMYVGPRPRPALSRAPRRRPAGRPRRWGALVSGTPSSVGRPRQQDALVSGMPRSRSRDPGVAPVERIPQLPYQHS